MTEAKKQANAVIAAVAQRLGNTPAICRKSYVHPAVIDAFLAGELAKGEALTGAKRLLRLLVALARRQRSPRVRVLGRAATKEGTRLAPAGPGGASATGGAP